jgi:hypothetical protein
MFLTSAVEISVWNHREKTEHSEVLVFLSFPQESAGIVPGNGLLKFRPHRFQIVIFSLPNSLRCIVSVIDVVKETKVNTRGLALFELEPRTFSRVYVPTSWWTQITDLAL